MMVFMPQVYVPYVYTVCVCGEEADILHWHSTGELYYKHCHVKTFGNT